MGINKLITNIFLNKVFLKNEGYFLNLTLCCSFNQITILFNFFLLKKKKALMQNFTKIIFGFFESLKENRQKKLEEKIKRKQKNKFKFNKLFLYINSLYFLLFKYCLIVVF